MRIPGNSLLCLLAAWTLLCAILLAFAFPPLLASEGKGKWQGVDESIVEKVARDHGREAHTPLINTDQGDLLLFVFLLAGAVGGFAAGYYWKSLIGRTEARVPKEGP